MEQQDYLKKQIDQLGQVLANLLVDILRLTTGGRVDTGIEITNQTLKTELGLDIQDLIDIPTDSIIDILTKQKSLTNDNLVKLAEILMLIADNSQYDTKKLYKICLTIYEYLELVENIYKLDRQWEIKRIKNKLS